MKGYLLGWLLVSVINQGSGAPFADQCFSRCDANPDARYGGWAFLLFPWRRNEHGDRLAGKALAVTWEGYVPGRRLPIRGTTLEMTCTDECGPAPVPRQGE